MKTKAIGRVGLALGLAMVGGLMVAAWAANDAPPQAYHSPFDVAFSPDGKLLAVSDRTAKALAFVDVASGKVLRQAALSGQPGRIAWSPDASKAYVAQYESASVAEISAADAKVIRTMPAGTYPLGTALAAKRQLLLVGNTALADVSVIDLASGKEKARIKVQRDPFHIALSPDESLAVVSNLLPAMPASDPQATAALSILDLQKLEKIADIKLPPNTTSIRQTAVSPDGLFAYAVHTVGRTTLPATQLERGWVNTNALSIIDLKKMEVVASVLMDNLAEGAADPWGIALDKDGSTMWVSISGVHQVARIDLAGLHKGLKGEVPVAPLPGMDPAKIKPPPSLWTEIKADPAKKAELVNDLAALYVGGLITRPVLPGKAPRGIALSPDGKQLAVAMYYSGQVLLVDPASLKVNATLALGPQRQVDQVRRGEMIFHDATYSFQHWLSCATCHPNEARTDGLNWDLPNDGIGNPKSVKSLLQADKTPPSMWTGVRDNMITASTAGFRFAAYQPQPEDLRAVQAYLKSLQPLKSPYLTAQGQLSAKAQRGKALFEDQKTNCANCHSGAYYADGKQHDVGTQGPLDLRYQNSFDTPTLIELWRTAPYLHDGRAATLQEVFTKSNSKDQHGATSHLSKEQLDDLVEYLLSL